MNVLKYSSLKLLTGITIISSTAASCGREAVQTQDHPEAVAPAPTSTPVPAPLPVSTPQLPSKEPLNLCAPIEAEGYLKSENETAYVLLKWLYGPSVTPSESRAQLLFVTSQCEFDLAKFAVTHVKPWMSVHSHGAPTNELRIQKETTGFSVTGLYFVMSGPWELIVQFTGPDGRPDSIEFKVAVP